MLFFKKAFRWGYSCDLRRLSVLLHEADEHLFHKMVHNKDHCIHQLLHPEKILPMKLRATNNIVFLLCLSVTITYTNVCFYYDICISDVACRSVVALSYFISFHFIFLIDIVPILLCYVLFCNGVWPLFNKRLLTYLLRLPGAFQYLEVRKQPTCKIPAGVVKELWESWSRIRVSDVWYNPESKNEIFAYRPTQTS